MEEINHWQNKVWVGIGTLAEFAEQYDMINAGTMQFATASQLFPTGTEKEGNMIFEYLIYYKVHPAALKSLSKEGQIIMTEKEGRELDPNIKKVEELEV